ncbi:MAG: carcinine hydrolase/isopenicillin-N N-acyltransferase family protein [Candidatus Thorarchaeota archaeon]|nr:carcinine hydrolase/isopenicillin-N N-acyltransferase family protein [Candidatus Thorarchaeota archaeon]
MRILHAIMIVMHLSSISMEGPLYAASSSIEYTFSDYEGTSAFTLEECTSIIVTENASKDGRPILMKNRDSSETNNVPTYIPATNTTYAYAAVNSMWMGINEKGLAVMNTAMPYLSDMPSPGSFNGLLNRRILKYCENVSDLKHKLDMKSSLLYSDAGFGGVSIATCVGVVDRDGRGAFFEISDIGYSMEEVVDGYQSRANHPRTYPGLASGPNGRDEYALEALDEIYEEKGIISWEDVAQRVSRYVNKKESTMTGFTIGGEICNDNTVSAMVAVSGDVRYEGKLNIMWCEYGLVPIVGVFLPSMVYGGTPPSVLQEMVNYTQEKVEYAHGVYEDIYIASRVREIQNYSFTAENYAAKQYNRLIEQVPLGLSDDDLSSTLRDYIDLTVSVCADMYVNETSQMPDYAVNFNVTAEPSATYTSTPSTITDTSTSNTSGTITQSTDYPTIPEAGDYSELLRPVIGFSSGIVPMIVLIAYLNRKWK